MALLYILGAIVVIIALAVIFIPKSTTFTKEITFDASIDDVWRIYTQPAKQAEWRPGVGKVNMSADGQTWTETLTQGNIVIHFEIIEETAPHRYVLKTSSPNSFEGQYIAEFKQVGNQTIGTFTEQATSLSIIAKLIRFIFVNQEKQIDDYAKHAKVELAYR